MTKKSEILEAAIKCFTLYGYQKTSMSDIGSKVGLNKASLYYHYKDKLSLYEAVIAYIRKKQYYSILKKIEAETSYLNKILCFIENEMAFIAEMASTYFRGIYTADLEVKYVFDRIIYEDTLVVKDLLDRGITERIFNCINTDKLSSEIIQMAQGMILLNCPLELPAEERHEAYASVSMKIQDLLQLMFKGLMQV